MASIYGRKVKAARRVRAARKDSFRPRTTEDILKTQLKELEATAKFVVSTTSDVEGSVGGLDAALDDFRREHKRVRKLYKKSAKSVSKDGIGECSLCGERFDLGYMLSDEGFFLTQNAECLQAELVRMESILDYIEDLRETLAEERG